MLKPTRRTSQRLQRLLTLALSFGTAACGTSGGGDASDTGVAADASSAAEGGAPSIDARLPGDAAAPSDPDAAGPAELDAAGPDEPDAAGPGELDAALLGDGAMPPDTAAGEDAHVERTDAGVESADALPPALDADVPGPLETFIDQPPPALTNQRVLPVRLRASTPAATFECRLDDGAFEPCAARPGLVVPEDGPHVFQARAVLGPSVDPSPAEVAFTLDTVPPALAVEGGPTGEHPRAATFLAAWDPADATLSCTLDGRPLAECLPEVALVGLSEGPHRLEVTATDAAGNSTTRQVEWRVVVETRPLAAPEERRFYATSRVERAARVAVGPDGVAHHIYGTARLWYRSTAPDAPVEVVDDVPVSLVSSVAVGTSGVPHVVYFDRRGGRLKHAWRAADGWQVEDTGLVEDLAPKRSIDDGLALVVRPDEGLELLWAQESVERLIQHATRPAVPDAGGPALVGPEAWTNQRFLPDSDNDGEIGLLALPDGELWAAWCHGDGSSPWQTALWTRAAGWQAQPMPDATPACRGRAPPAKLSLRGDGGIDAVLGSTLFMRPVGADGWGLVQLPGLNLPAGALSRDEPGTVKVDGFMTGDGSVVSGDLSTWTVGPDGVVNERRLRLGPENAPRLASFDRWPGGATHGHLAWPTRIEDVDPTPARVARRVLDEGYAYGPLNTSPFWGDAVRLAVTRTGAPAPDAPATLSVYFSRQTTDAAGRTVETPVVLTTRDAAWREHPMPAATGPVAVDERGRFFRLVGGRQVVRFDPETAEALDYPALADEGQAQAMYVSKDGVVFLRYSAPERIVRLTAVDPPERLPMPDDFDPALVRGGCPLRIAGGEVGIPLMAVYTCISERTEVIVWREAGAEYTVLPAPDGPVVPFAAPTRLGFVALPGNEVPLMSVHETSPQGWMRTDIALDAPPTGFTFDAALGPDERLRVLVNSVLRTDDPLDDPFGERLDSDRLDHWVETSDGWHMERLGVSGGDAGLYVDPAGDTTLVWWDRQAIAWRMARR